MTPRGNVQDEDPTPRGEVGNHTTEDGAQYRAGHDRRSPNCEHATVVSLGIDVEKNGLCQGLDDAGCDTLDQPELDQRGGGWRDRTEHRGENE